MIRKEFCSLKNEESEENEKNAKIHMALMLFQKNS
jgi:hypothetical protein